MLPVARPSTSSKTSTGSGSEQKSESAAAYVAGSHWQGAAGKQQQPQQQQSTLDTAGNGTRCAWVEACRSQHVLHVSLLGTLLTVCCRACPPACRALASMDYAGAAEAYTAALAVDPAHRHVNKQLQLGLCKVQQQLGKAEEAVQVSQGRTQQRMCLCLGAGGWL